MHESERERSACPLYTAIKVVDGRWKPMLFLADVAIMIGAGLIAVGALWRDDRASPPARGTP